MSFEAAVARVSELNAMLVTTPPPPPRQAPAVGATTFAQMLQSANATGGAGGAAAVGASLTGGAGGMLAAAQAEVGQAEAPPGSNDSARIAEYRSVTAGAPGPGPWCAYFVSWAAKQAGTPVGDQGQGFGSVDALYGWAQRTGRAVPAAAGQPPRPGDLIVWDEHIGIVESVGPGGSIQTIEGNSSDRVSRRTHGPGGDGAVGYVRMGG